MKVTIQFANDETDELCEDMNVEIPHDVWQRLERMSQEQKCSVDSVVNHILKTLCEQAKDEITE